MARIRGKNTTPELLLRSLIREMGYGYRLKWPGLPCRPDIIFPGRKKVIFIHGCFWHQHEGCKIAKRPKTNTDYWNPKLERNIQRDVENLSKLSELGWHCLVLWECQIKSKEDLPAVVKSFLNE